MDTLIALPTEIIISVVETTLHAMETATTGHNAMLFAWMQSLLCLSIIGFSAVLEFWVSSHISMLLDTEKMVKCFRRMLRGVSDGEVLLNDEMQLCEDADCLKHLLMTGSDFRGRQFERLLVPEERARFRDFLKQSMAEVPTQGERTKTPPCLRVSLRGASDIRVGVDLWHVPGCQAKMGCSSWCLKTVKRGPCNTPTCRAQEKLYVLELKLALYQCGWFRKIVRMLAEIVVLLFARFSRTGGHDSMCGCYHTLVSYCFCWSTFFDFCSSNNYIGWLWMIQSLTIDFSNILKWFCTTNQVWCWTSPLELSTPAEEFGFHAKSATPGAAHRMGDREVQVEEGRRVQWSLEFLKVSLRSIFDRTRV